MLTPAGSVVVEHCRKTLFDFEKLQELVGDIRDKRREHIEIMVVDSAVFGLIQDVLATFSVEYPGVTYSITTALPDEIMLALSEGEVDVGFTFSNEPRPDIRVVGEKSAPIGAIMLPDHPLAERTSLEFRDLADCNLIRSIDARGQKSLVDETIAGATAHLTTFMFTNSLPVAKDLIMGGQGVGLYTKLGFRSDVMSGKLCFVPLRNEYLEGLKIGILISSRRTLTPMKHLLATEFRKALRLMRLDS